MNLNEIAENAHRTAITRERNGGAVKIRDILKHTADAAEHPLVTDPRFLKLSYFPDVTPACFSEGE